MLRVQRDGAPRFVARASFPPVASGFITRRLGDPRCICSFFSSPARLASRLASIGVEISSRPPPTT
eukprot:30856-Pelagococcus_subviridis.AAC.6